MLGICLIGACVFLNRTTPLYQSTSGLLIETNMPSVGGGEGMQASQGGSTYLATQCTLMKSPTILNSVVARPDIASPPIGESRPKPAPVSPRKSRSPSAAIG